MLLTSGTVRTKGPNRRQVCKAAAGERSAGMYLACLQPANVPAAGAPHVLELPQGLQPRKPACAQDHTGVKGLRAGRGGCGQGSSGEGDCYSLGARAAWYLSLHSAGCALPGGCAQGRKCWDVLIHDPQRGATGQLCGAPSSPASSRKPGHLGCSPRCCPAWMQVGRVAAREGTAQHFLPWRQPRKLAFTHWQLSDNGNFLLVTEGLVISGIHCI